MKEILVLNLNRYGDLIQTTPLLRRLKAMYPSARITLAAQQRFSAILPLMTGYDRCLLFDQDSVMGSLAQSRGVPSAFRTMEQYMAKLEADHYDLAINLTANRMSAYVVSLLNTDQVAGITATDNGQRQIRGNWGLYLYSFLLGDARRYNRINLVDIFCKMAGVTPDGQPVELHESEAGQLFANTFLHDKGIGAERLVGLQLGASDTDRCWPIESFACLSDRLQEIKGIRTIMFGSPTERPIADQAISLMKYAPINAVGATNIEQLFSLLRKCALLVTNDTGTMHFAAAGGIPVVMLTVGPAAFLCTGPYSSGNLAIQPPIHCSPCRYLINCNNPICRSLITVEDVMSACRYLLGDTATVQDSENGARFYQSDFGQDGFLEWAPLCNEDAGMEGLSRRYAKLWKQSLDHEASSPAVQQPLYPELVLLTEQGMKLTHKIMAAARRSPIPMKAITALGAEESSVEAALRQLAVTNPATAPVVDYLTILRENISSDDLLTVAATTHEIYRQGNCLTLHL